nr:unnamed protein product [Spirometra erinaceieuropaei]
MEEAEEENNQLAFLDVLVCRKDCDSLKKKCSGKRLIRQLRYPPPPSTTTISAILATDSATTTTTTSPTPSTGQMTLRTHRQPLLSLLPTLLPTI